MRNLYEIKEAYMQVQNLIEQGELDHDMLVDTLDGISGELEEKAENYGLVIKNLEGQALMIDEEIKRLQERSKSIKSNCKRVQDYLLGTMLDTGKMKFTTSHFTFSTRKSEAVVVEAEELIPAEYIKEKLTTSVDKTALKKAIKQGEVIEGARLEKRTNLTMR